MKRIFIMFTAVIVALLVICFLLIVPKFDEAAKLVVYDFGSDQMPTVNSVIGEERSVTGLSAGVDGSTQYKEYTYDSSSVFDDLSRYLVELRESGWSVMSDYDLNTVPGEAKLGINSVDEGKAVFLTVRYEESGYTVRVEKITGSITPIEQ